MQPKEHIEATLAAADIYDTAQAGDNSDSAKWRKLSPAGWKNAFQRVLRDFLPEGLMDLGALLTYFSILSLSPALLVGYSLLTLFLASDSLEIMGRVRDLVATYVPEEQSDIVLNAIDTIAGSASAGRVGLIVGVLVALWTSSSYVRAFSRCANAVYGRTEGRTLLKHWGVMVLLNFGLLISAILIAVALVINETLVMRIFAPIAEPLHLTGTLSFLTDTFIPLWNWVKWPVILVLLIILVATMYHFAPNVRPRRFRWLTAGSAIAISGIFITGGVLNIYFSYFASFNSYGAVGSVLALFVGLWICNTLLITGTKIDAEISRARQLQAGFPAEIYNLTPPRSIKAVVTLTQLQQRSEEQARIFRDGQQLPRISADDEAFAAKDSQSD